MSIRRKPVKIMGVNWAGSTLHLQDRATWEKIPVYVIIVTLPYSQYSYVEGVIDMKSPSWLTAHIHALEYFGGLPDKRWSHTTWKQV